MVGGVTMLVGTLFLGAKTCTGHTTSGHRTHNKGDTDKVDTGQQGDFKCTDTQSAGEEKQEQCALALYRAVPQSGPVWKK